MERRTRIDGGIVMPYATRLSDGRLRRNAGYLYHEKHTIEYLTTKYELEQKSMVETDMTQGTAALAVAPQPEITIFPTDRASIIAAIASAVQRNAAIEEVRRNMVAGLHYGNIPNIEKPSLSKAGAEFINDVYGLRPQYEPLDEKFDWDTGIVYFRYRCTLVHRTSNIVVGEGIGNCSSRETKYWFRTAKRACPKCNEESIIKSKRGDGWYCWSCKTGFGKNDSSITSQKLGRVKNEDIFDLPNTIDKMAQKRAYVAATLSATNASQFFTQDLEDRYNDILEGEIIDDAPAATQQPAQEAKRSVPSVWPKQDTILNFETKAHQDAVIQLLEKHSVLDTQIKAHMGVTSFTFLEDDARTLNKIEASIMEYKKLASEKPATTKQEKENPVQLDLTNADDIKKINGALKPFFDTDGLSMKDVLYEMEADELKNVAPSDRYIIAFVEAAQAAVSRKQLKQKSFIGATNENGGGVDLNLPNTDIDDI